MGLSGVWKKKKLRDLEAISHFSLDSDYNDSI